MALITVGPVLCFFLGLHFFPVHNIKTCTRVTMQWCRQWHRKMAIAILIAIAELRCTKIGILISEECQKPQPPLLLKIVSQYTSYLYCSTPPTCIAVLLAPLDSKERETLSVLLPFVSQYASHLYCSTPPICIAVLLRNLGGCGHRDVPHDCLPGTRPEFLELPINRGSPAFAPKDYLILPLQIYGEIQEFGPYTRQSESQHLDVNMSARMLSGVEKTDLVRFHRRLKQALLACRNGRFESSVSPLG